MSTNQFELKTSASSVDTALEVENHSLANSRKTLGKHQLYAMIKKNFIIKRRRRCQTCCEIFTPMILLLTAVLGYSLSNLDVFPAQIYASDSIPLVDGIGEFATSLIGDSINNISIAILTNTSNTICEDGAFPVAAGVCGTLTPQQTSSSTFNFNTTIALPDPIVDAVVANLESGNITNPPFTFSLNFSTTPPELILVNNTDDSTIVYDSSVFNDIITELNATTIAGLQNQTISELALELLTGESPGESVCVPISPVICLNLSLTINATVFNEALAKALVASPNSDFDVGAFINSTQLLDYSGPLPVLNLDLFVFLAGTIQGYVDSSRSQISSVSTIDPRFDNLLRLGRLYIAPDNFQTQNFISDMKTSSIFFTKIFGGVFEDEDSLVAYAKEDRGVFAAIYFTNFDIEGGNINYKIRMKHRLLPRTRTLVNKFKLGLNKDYQEYWFSGFLSLQKMIDDYVISRALGNVQISTTTEIASLLSSTASQPTNFVFVPFPTRLYSENLFFVSAGPLIGLIIVMSMLYPVSRLIKAVVEEKELLLKQTMLIMGLKDWVFASSWFISYLIMFTIESIIMTIIAGSSFLGGTNKLILFLFFFLFTTSLITFSFLVSMFFSRAKLAAIVGPVILFAALLPRFAFFGGPSNYQIGEKTLSCLLSPTAASFGLSLFVDYEGAGLPVTWSALADDDFSFFSIFLMILLDIIIYGLLAWYFDKVLPNMYGIRQHPLFCFRNSYWLKEAVAIQDPSESPLLSNDLIEEIPPSLQSNCSIRIRGLTKRFENNVLAVDNLSLDIFRDEITTLLGKNGSGKSTTISMLTGLYMPTSGMCYINGKSVTTEMSSIRGSIGICPQQNILFDHLTVEEHLSLYCVLKGVPIHRKNTVVQEMLHESGLHVFRGVCSMDLSGGNKRKLCCANALIGNSSVIFLDEPSSGMDVLSRRATWNMLRRQKQGRTIILTTHFMDEADLLGDRIAILSAGNLQCAGTGLFLKNRFGLGYYLTLVRKADQVGAWNRRAIFELIHSFIPDAACLSSSGGEIAMQLPLVSVDLFPELFEEIELRSDELQLAGHGISMTTLEEVFLRLAQEGTDVKEISAAQNAITTTTDTIPKNAISLLNHEDEIDLSFISPVENGIRLKPSIFHEIWFLFHKRWVCSKRDYKGRFFEVVLPILMMAMIMGILSIPFDIAGPPLTLTPDLYGNPVDVPYSSASNTASLKYLKKEPVLNMESIYANDSIELSRYLLNTVKSHRDRRFGAFSWSDTYDDASTILRTEATVLFNASSSHSLPVFLSALSQARYKEALNDQSASILTTFDPLPLTEKAEFRVRTFLTLFAALFSLIPYCYLPATFTIFIVKERTLKSKHIQLLSGVSPISYWISTFLWDFLNFVFVIISSLLVFAMFDSIEFVKTWELAMATFLVLFMYAFAVLPLTYCYSFFFTNHSSAQVAIAGIHFIFGFILVIASFILGSLEETMDANEDLIHIYRIFPTFDFGESLINVATVSFISSFRERDPHPFDWDVIGRDLVYLAVEGVFFWAILLIIEYDGVSLLVNFLRIKFGSTLVPTSFVHKEDEDVAAEKARIDNNDPSLDNDSIILRHLRKVYPPSGSAPPCAAVEDLSLGIRKHEVFCLLGVNGAGKTTTLSILAGDIKQTSGTATVAGFDTRTDIQKSRSELGYCPQFDPLLELMTPRETFQMYCRLRGLSADRARVATEWLIDKLGISEHADTHSVSLSGGNKRKCSLGISLIGDPAILMLDEVASGVDPSSRRLMWNLISAIGCSRTIVLITHSMEECEALSTRLGIMVAGNLMCLGTPQHLKIRFGAGYHMELTTDESMIDAVKSFMASQFVGASLEEFHAGRLKYRLPSQGISLSAIFRHLEEKKKELRIHDYSISQSTLEQIFLSFARQQQDHDQRLLDPELDHQIVK